MEPEERARVSVAIEHTFRDAMHQAIASRTQDADEQLQIGGAVLALMLRKMYQQQGQAWLEAVIKQVLQP